MHAGVFHGVDIGATGKHKIDILGIRLLDLHPRLISERKIVSHGQLALLFYYDESIPQRISGEEVNG